MNCWIPLLSGKSLKDFTPEEFKLHVRGLYFNPPKYKKPPKKKPKLPFKWRLNAKGTLCLTFNRKPKYLTREEVLQIITESGLEEHLVWAKVSGKKSGIRIYDTKEEVEEIQADTKKIP